MRRSLLLGLFLFVGVFLTAALPVFPLFAQESVAVRELTRENVATIAGEATDSATATSSAAIQQVEEKKEDITAPSVGEKSKLATFLEENPVGNLTWHNPLQHAIRGAIFRGLSANIVVLLILFPIIASIIAMSRHVIGLKGFGIYIPAVLSVAFASTGITIGILVFVVVLTAAVLFRTLIKYLKMQYLPRTALLLWGVSLVILAVLIAASYASFISLIAVNIFPILIIILLTENFIETQLFSSQKQALRLTVETLLVAIACTYLITSDYLQQFVIMRPEATLLGVAVINYLVGKYSGLRLLEYLRFKSLLER